MLILFITHYRRTESFNLREILLLELNPIPIHCHSKIICTSNIKDIVANSFPIFNCVQAKFASFFGPGITAEVGKSENSKNSVYVLILMNLKATECV